MIQSIFQHNRLYPVLVFAVLVFCCKKREGADDTSASTPAENFSITFQRGDSIFTRSKDQEEIFVLTGRTPCLSTDGRRLAYTKFDETGRTVFIYDIQRKKEEPLQVPGANFYEPIWSPDGQYIAFNYMDSADWKIGVIKSDNTEFHTINGKPGWGLYSPTWTDDSQSIVAHNLQELFRFDIKGNVIHALNITETLGDETSLSSDNRFWITGNGDILYNSGVAEGMEGVEGPVYAIQKFNVKSNNIERISPAKMYATNLMRITGNIFLYEGAGENQIASDIYMYNNSTGQSTRLSSFMHHP